MVHPGKLPLLVVVVHKCIQTLTLPMLGLNYQQTTNEICHTWRGLRSAVRGSDLWHTCSMIPQTLSQRA